MVNAGASGSQFSNFALEIKGKNRTPRSSSHSFGRDLGDLAIPHTGWAKSTMSIARRASRPKPSSAPAGWSGSDALVEFDGQRLAGEGVDHG
jgi:hypothetical protein